MGSSRSFEGPAGSSRWLALVVLCAGMLMIILDQTVVNVALPAIQRDLDFSQSGLAWVVNAYLIGASLDSALTGGYHLAFGISAGLVLSSNAVAATVVRDLVWHRA